MAGNGLLSTESHISFLDQVSVVLRKKTREQNRHKQSQEIHTQHAHVENPHFSGRTAVAKQRISHSMPDE
jgi:hypothetical protein